MKRTNMIKKMAVIFGAGMLTCSLSVLCPLAEESETEISETSVEQTGSENAEETFVFNEDGTVLVGLTDYGKTLTHIEIPEGITEISKDALSGYIDGSVINLTSVTIPNSVQTIGQGAFCGISGLTEIVIPDSVTSIGTNCFQGCEKLSSVQLSGALTELPEAAFAETAITELIVPQRVTKIGVFCFGGCKNLTTIQLSKSVTELEEAAFVGCAAANVTIPVGSRLASINPAAFAECPLDGDLIAPLSMKELLQPIFGEHEVKWADDTLSTDTLFIEKLDDEVIVAGLTDFGKTAEAIDIPEGVTMIGTDALSGYIDGTSLNYTHVTIPETVREIGQGAFCGTALTEAVIPDSVTKLGTNCFQGCNNLESLQLSNSLTELPEAAFAETAVKQLSIPEGITKIGVFCFGRCANLEAVKLPESLEALDEAAFVGCASIKNVEIPSGSKLTSVHEAAFAGCAVENVTAPSALKEVIGNAFGELQVTWIED